MARYIDDLFAIILWRENDGFKNLEWSNFKEDMDDFGILRWEVNEPTDIVDHLDITLELKNQQITTKTYQKPINLY